MPYKILSLDGGGSWALLEALALSRLFTPTTPGREILANFQMVAANSGGSLVAGALVANLTPAAIVDLFRNADTRNRIFVGKWIAPLTRKLRFGPRYRTAAKLVGIRDVLNSMPGRVADQPLDALEGVCNHTNFLITAFDYDRQRATFFRSDNANGAGSERIVAVPTLAEAIHASSNAPVNYFDRPATFATPAFAGRRFWDGGTAGLNNPVLAATIEALAHGCDPQQIAVLSLGTGSVLLPRGDGSPADRPYTIEPAGTGLLTALKTLTRTILADPPDAATYEAARLLHGKDLFPTEWLRLVRLNPMIQPFGEPGAYRPPSGLTTDEFVRLVALDMDATKQADVELIRRFGDLWLADATHNQAIQNYDDLTMNLGYETFTAGAARARQLGLCP